MNCKTALMLKEITGGQPGELPAEDFAALEKHFSECPSCQDALQAQEAEDQPIRIAMKNVPIPNGLQGRILDRLRHERGAVHRRRIWWTTAAASLLFLLFGMFYWQPRSRSKLDLNQIVYHADQFNENPKEELNAWLAKNEARFQLAKPFDPHLLAFYGMSSLQGKQVPMLYFRSQEHGQPVFAQVFLVNTRDFDLASLPQSFSGSSARRYQLQVYRDAELPNEWAYIILFDSDTLDPFHLQFTPA